MPQYKLTYFDGPGRGEVTRWLLTTAGKDFEDFRYKEETDPSIWRPSTPFGQLPMLQVDGTTLCQSHVIERYLAQEFGLAGKNNLEQARVAMIVECIEESTFGPFTKIYYEKDPTRKEQIKKEYIDKFSTYLKYLDNFAKGNKGGNGYFVGDQVTYADMVFLSQVDSTDNELKMGINWDNWPTLKKIRANVANHPGVKAWEAKRAAAAK